MNALFPIMMTQCVVQNPNGFTLGQIVHRICNRNREIHQDSRFYMCNNALLNSPIEIDMDTEDLVEPGDLLIRVRHGQYDRVYYIASYM